MSYSEQPPLKHSRQTESDNSRQLQEGESTTDQYLECFNQQSPIAVLLTPIRKRQEQIFFRNLSQAGAFVIDAESSNDANISEQAELTVVTDKISKAELRLKPFATLFKRVRFVSTKWASRVLSSCTPIPLEGYTLDTNDGSHLSTASEERPDHEHLSTQEVSTPSSQQPFLPVWYTGPRAPSTTSDISEKESLLRALPPFLCHRSTFCQSIYPCPNKALCDVLERLAEKRGLEQAGGTAYTADIRSRAYRQASAALKCVPFRLQNAVDGRALRSFGPRVLEVANEFLTSGAVEEAEVLDKDCRLRTMQQFCKMYGIGVQTARILYDVRGIRDLATLRKQVKADPEKFSASLVGYISFLDEMGEATLDMARRYCNRVESIVNDGADGGLQVRMVLCGGFRRGECVGHDVDLLYCKKRGRTKNTSSILQEVAGSMRKHGLLVATLHMADDKNSWKEQRYTRITSASGGGARSKYRFAHDTLHGLGCFEGKTFRVDVVGVRDEMEFPFATMAWSGSTSFQRDLREMCQKRHDWTFNAHGIFRRCDGERVEIFPRIASEVDIFSAMGLVYRPPFERCC